MTPYQIFSEAVIKDPHKTFGEMWCDFAIWESTRGYSDDPSASSKDAVAWVRNLAELAAQLDDFKGAAKEDCRNALESVFVAFSRLDHDDDLCTAVQRWRERRLAEEAEKNNPTPFRSI